MRYDPGTIKPEQQYLEFLANRKFMLLRNRRTGNVTFFPRAIEPRTGSTDLEWVEASGNGIVYATTTMRGRNPADDYNVAIVELDEGPRMMSRIDGVPPADVRIDMRVKAEFIEQDGKQIVVFRPSGQP